MDDGNGSQIRLIDEAARSVVRTRSGSTSRLMRDLNVSYRQAYALMQELERRRVVSAANAAGARSVLSS